MFNWLKPYLRGAVAIMDIGGTMHPQLDPKSDGEALEEDWKALEEDWKIVLGNSDPIMAEFHKFLYAVELTESIFGKPLIITTDHDPEYPLEVYAVFKVKCKRQVALEKEGQWCQQMAAVPPQLDIRLSIEVE